MTSDYATVVALLGTGVGFLYALAFQLLPGLTPWFEKKPKEAKSQFMLLLLVVTAIALAVGSCYTSFFSDQLVCTQRGFEQIVGAVFIALMGGILGNQPTHSLAKNAFPTYGTLDVDVPPYHETDPGLFK